MHVLPRVRIGLPGPQRVGNVASACRSPEKLVQLRPRKWGRNSETVSNILDVVQELAKAPNWIQSPKKLLTHDLMTSIVLNYRTLLSYSSIENRGGVNFPNEILIWLQGVETNTQSF